MLKTHEKLVCSSTDAAHYHEKRGNFELHFHTVQRFCLRHSFSVTTDHKVSSDPGDSGLCLAARSRSVFPGEGGSGGGSSGSPRSSKSMDRPLKAGWLKKQQRGLVKNWQQRYFVLRGTTLTYHKDKETAVQVSHWSVCSDKLRRQKVWPHVCSLPLI